MKAVALRTSLLTILDLIAHLIPLGSVFLHVVRFARVYRILWEEYQLEKGEHSFLGDSEE